MAQNKVARAHRHLGVRNRGMEHSIAADVTMKVIFTRSLARFQTVEVVELLLRASI
jgi:hypothetical protein